ncbi:MAG: L-2-hydroxyglutarate oxidase, partial [Bacteroidota bacterium]
MSQGYDVTIIGAGIVGLATAWQIRQQYPQLRMLILEKEAAVAQHQSSHNSGVIHSGVYYQPGSAKATNCTRGYQYLLEFCKQYELPFDLCGKVIVATEEAEIPRLLNIYERGVKNGLKHLEILNQKGISEKEPHVKGLKAIWVPQAGCIRYADVAQKLAELLQESGVEICCNQEVKKIQNQEIIAKTAGFSSRLIITCGGLYSDKLVELSGLKANFRILPFRGEYYELKPTHRFLVNGLVYPVPDPAFPFLGVHFTKTIDGGIEAGPNAVLAFRREGYRWRQFKAGELLETVRYPGFRKLAAKHWRQGLLEQCRSLSKAQFTKALQKLIPDVRPDHLREGGAGVRAQACRPNGDLVDDFLFIEKPGLIHVANAPSPAATACLAVGETVAKL